MKPLRRDSSFVILLGLAGLIALKGLTSGMPIGMVIVFFAIFGVLKVVMGMKTWWHAILGGSLASILWLAFGNSGLTGMSLALVPALLAIVAALSVVKIAFRTRRQQSA